MIKDEVGASLVEYAFLLLLIAVVVAVVVGEVGTTASTSYGSVVDQGFGGP